MPTTSTWETVLLGVLVLLVIFWFRPGIASSLKISREADKDWAGFLIPIAFVILFIIFLVMIT